MHRLRALRHLTGTTEPPLAQLRSAPIKNSTSRIVGLAMERTPDSNPRHLSRRSPHVRRRRSGENLPPLDWPMDERVRASTSGPLPMAFR